MPDCVFALIDTASHLAVELQSALKVFCEIIDKVEDSPNRGTPG